MYSDWEHAKTSDGTAGDRDGRFLRQESHVNADSVAKGVAHQEGNNRRLGYIDPSSIAIAAEAFFQPTTVRCLGEACTTPDAVQNASETQLCVHHRPTFGAPKPAVLLFNDHHERCMLLHVREHKQTREDGEDSLRCTGVNQRLY